MDKIDSEMQHPRTIIKFKNDYYDITDFLNRHPGGAQIILDNQHNNVEELMENIGHSETAYALLEKYKILKF